MAGKLALIPIPVPPAIQSLIATGLLLLELLLCAGVLDWDDDELVTELLLDNRGSLLVDVELLVEVFDDELVALIDELDDTNSWMLDELTCVATEDFGGFSELLAPSLFPLPPQAVSNTSGRVSNNRLIDFP